MLIFAGGNTDTTVTSILIGQKIEQGNDTGAAALSIVLLLMALACLFVITMIQRWGSRHERAQGAGAGVGIVGYMSGLPFDPGFSSVGENVFDAEDLDAAPGTTPRRQEEDDQRE